jgi:hypothetical protein
MNIKSEDLEQNYCKKIQKWIETRLDLFRGIFGVFLIVVLLGSIAWLIHILIVSLTSNQGQTLAKKLVKKDYPAVICLSNNGHFRIYKEKSYTVYKHKEYGWNIYWTKKGPSNSSSFHLAKCEIK